MAVDFLTMLAVQVRADIEEAGRILGKKPTHREFEASTWALAMLGRAIKGRDYVLAVRRLHATGRVSGAFFQKYDVLLTPTLAEPPIPIGTLQINSLERFLLTLVGPFDAGWLLNAIGIVKPIAAKTFDFIPYTPLFNVTGQPAMSLPLHWSQRGLPVGMHFIGRFGDEATLLRLAGQLEEARPWFHRRPAGF